MNIQYYNLYDISNISPLLIRPNKFGLLRYTMHEYTSAKNQKMFGTLNMFIYHLYI